MHSSPSYQFSIILPVRNGGEYIKDCVQSILSQSVSSFNLIIMDSGSTDGTVEWVKDLRDPRIIAYPSDKPLSIEENWSRIKTIPRNEWMTIIGHDDLLQPEYLATMTELIQLYPDASLYQTHFDLIDAKGHLLRKCKPMEAVQSAKDLCEKILANEINIFGTGYMMRSADYDAVGGIPSYPNLLSADYVLWLELTGISYKATSPAHCFSYRIGQSTTAITKPEVYIAALKLFTAYLIKERERLSGVAGKNDFIKKVMSFYCKRVTRRLLNTTPANRNGLTVAGFLKETREYTRELLGKGDSFNPGAIPSIWVAKVIDSMAVTRKLFLMVKSIHPNPLV